jgi:hypothetical protein
MFNRKAGSFRYSREKINSTSSAVADLVEGEITDAVPEPRPQGSAANTSCRRSSDMRKSPDEIERRLAGR